MLNPAFLQTIRVSLLWALGAFAVGMVVGQAPFYDSFGGGLVIILALGVVAFLVLPRIARREHDPDEQGFLLRLLVAAFAFKIAGTLTRLLISFDIYGGRDAARYNNFGKDIALGLQSGDWGLAALHLQPGTPVTELFTGAVYAVMGSSLYGGFLLFGFMAFLGSMFYYLAFRIAVPHGRRRLFGLLIFFYPAILYWPSGLGKDAPIFLFTGLTTYGAARVLAAGQWTGVLHLLAGIGGVFLIRPHVALMLVVAIGLGMVFQRPATRSALLGKIVAIAAGFVVIGAIASSAATFLGVSSLTPDTVLALLSDQSSNDFEGAGGTSNFRPTPPTDPLWVPSAFVTVLFRPFAWEAHNMQALAQAVDGMVLLGILAIFGRRILTVLRHLRNHPFLVYLLIFAVITVLALSTFANFGLLARQRASVLPFLFMLLAFAPAPNPRPGPEKETAEQAVLA